MTQIRTRRDWAPASRDLAEVYRARFGDPRRTGSVPRLWHRSRYFTPDAYYEALVAKLVGPETDWLDIGCGRSLFPWNERLARRLADRCRTLVGVDPDETIEENPFVHVRVRAAVEDFVTDRSFDLVTLRMVAEHVERPAELVASLARLTRPGGRVVVFTINRWSPVSLAAWAVPFRFHHAVKRAVWGTEEKDTFPVSYRMNTRRALQRLFAAQGFRETYFTRLSDCRTTFRFRYLHGVELVFERALNRVGLAYPENCLLALYRRTGTR
jgi:2-polyprenyl-3-methyl-5-hydroxy-6-metoxy-1,4-benzoquinol methylase